MLTTSVFTLSIRIMSFFCKAQIVWSDPFDDHSISGTIDSFPFDFSEQYIKISCSYDDSRDNLDVTLLLISIWILQE